MLTPSRAVALALLAVFPSLQAADLAKGLAAVENRQWREAFAQFEPLAKRGDPRAEINLGNLYMRGLGVEQDYALARVWYEKAAQSGHPTGQAKLGMMYFLGLGLNEDHTEAARWFRKAAENGDSGAAMVLAEMHENGDGVERNPVEAFVWYSIATDLGEQDGVDHKARLADGLSPAQLNTALTQINVWRVQYNKRSPDTATTLAEPISDIQSPTSPKKERNGKKTRRAPDTRHDYSIQQNGLGGMGPDFEANQ